MSVTRGPLGATHLSLGRLVLFLFFLLLSPAVSQPAEVVDNGSDHWTIKGNGADLSEVCRKFFPGKNVAFYPGPLSIKVDGTISGHRDKVKEKLKKKFDIEIFDVEGYVAIRSVKAKSGISGKGFFLGPTKKGKWELLVTEHQLKEILDAFTKVLPKTVTISSSEDVKKLVAKDINITKDNPTELLEELAKKVGQLEIQKRENTYYAVKVDNSVKGRIWTLRNIGQSNLSGDLDESVKLEESKEAESVATILNTALGTTAEGKKTATAVGNQIVLKSSKKSDLDQAEFLLATHLDVPASQVHLDVWSVQMSTELKKSKHFKDRLGRVNEGYQIVRYLLGRTSVHFSEYLRAVGVKDADFLREIGFETNVFRPLSPTDMLILMAFVEREGKDHLKLKEYMSERLLTDIKPIKEGLESEKGERSSHLLALIEELEKSIVSNKFARTNEAYLLDVETPGSAKVSFLDSRPSNYASTEDRNHSRAQGSLRRFAGSYLDWSRPDWRKQNEHFSPTEKEKNDAKALNATDEQKRKAEGSLPTKSRSPRDIVRFQMEGDILLRSGVKAVSADLDNMFYTPFLQWVHEEVKDVTETSIVARTAIVVDSRHLGRIGAEAVSFHPLTPNPEKEQTELFEVLRADPKVNVLDVLLRPKPNPVFTHLSPGVSMAVVPTVSSFGDQAHLSIALNMAVEASDPNSLQEKGIRPADMVKSATLRTDTTVVGYDFLELSTIGLTDSRVGDPWGIPILQDIPLLGPVIFRYRGRPVRKHKEVLMFVQATIFPRTMDLVR